MIAFYAKFNVDYLGGRLTEEDFKKAKVSDACHCWGGDTTPTTFQVSLPTTQLSDHRLFGYTVGRIQSLMVPGAESWRICYS
jgi:hypothetical protein